MQFSSSGKLFLISFLIFQRIIITCLHSVQESIQFAKKKFNYSSGLSSAIKKNYIKVYLKNNCEKEELMGREFL